MESMDAGKYPTMHKTAPMPKNYLVQNANSANIEKHFLIHIANLFFLVYNL